MKRTIVIICTMLLLPLFVFGTEAEDLAREFFRIDLPQELLSAEAFESLDDDDSGLLKGLLEVVLVDDMDYQALEDLCVPIIMQEYSTQEMQDIISFLKTPAGKKYGRNNALGKSYLSIALEDQIKAAAGESDDWIRQMLSEFFDIFKLDELEDDDF